MASESGGIPKTPEWAEARCGIPAETIRRLAAGVVSIKEGAWFAPTADGTDTGGCAIMLAEDRSAPCGAATNNTNLVEIAAVG
jgi:anaerobic dimethyl sulfoxide reductase subunit A